MSDQPFFPSDPMDVGKTEQAGLSPESLPGAEQSAAPESGSWGEAPGAGQMGTPPRVPVEESDSVVEEVSSERRDQTESSRPVEGLASGEAVEPSAAGSVPTQGEESPRGSAGPSRESAPAAEPLPEKKQPEKLPKSENMEWYILKVQTNREESIREGLLRRAAIAGLDHYFGEIIIPTEKVTEFKGGKKRISNRKLYPGYLVVQMELNDDTWFLVRETPGIGDFTGAIGRPAPLLPHEVSRILAKKEEKTDESPRLKIGFHLGDRVKITEGTFENFEGEVSAIDETNGRVTVMISIFNRTTPVEFEYWQLEKV
ncbi:MAG TPA: transcription termination/antitermination protein NusG [Thermoguttaceae bacterium]|nr:transcription termination/antitermination protein NusG [Thermoguttaceae bacterium]HPP52357.1 transcription termination/antitermination protein NusG [Thermoguttaceae bacterium]